MTFMLKTPAAFMALLVFSSSCRAAPTLDSDFRVQAVLSEMMLIAETCQEQDEYNVALRKRLNVFLPARERIRSHFMKRGGEKAFDRYITELANAQSQESMKLYGAQFCEYRHQVIDDIARGDDPLEVFRAEELVDTMSTVPHSRKWSGSESIPKKTRGASQIQR